MGSRATGYCAGYNTAGDMTCRAVGANTCATAPTSGQTLGYDALRRLLSWQNASTSPTQAGSYAYDGSSERVWQRTTDVSGGTTTATTAISVLGVEDAVATTTTTNGMGFSSSTERRSYALPGGLTATRDSSGLAYSHSDRLGTPIATVQLDSATVTGVQLRIPYGQARYGANTTSGGSVNGMHTPYGFTGQREDSSAAAGPGASGLDYFHARYYDPVVGRFTSADSALGADAFGDNYAYVGGMVERATDPSGQYAASTDFAPPSTAPAPTTPDVPPAEPEGGPGEVVILYLLYQAYCGSTHNCGDECAISPCTVRTMLTPKAYDTTDKDGRLPHPGTGYEPLDPTDKDGRLPHGPPKPTPPGPTTPPEPGNTPTSRPVTQSWDPSPDNMPTLQEGSTNPCIESGAVIVNVCASWESAGYVHGYRIQRRNAERTQRLSLLDGGRIRVKTSGGMLYVSFRTDYHARYYWNISAERGNVPYGIRFLVEEAFVYAMEELAVAQDLGTLYPGFPQWADQALAGTASSLGIPEDLIGWFRQSILQESGEDWNP